MPGKASKAARQHITGGRLTAYEAMKSSGMSKSTAARIANAGKTAAGQSRMSRKAAATRRRRG